MKNFNEIYENVYKQSNDELENLRKGTILRALVIIIISLLLDIIILQVFPTFIPVIIVLTLIIVLLCTRRKSYRTAFKQKVIGNLVKEYDENLQFTPNAAIPRSVYMDAEFEAFDRYSSEDLIQGTILENYKFQMAEVQTEVESTDEDGHTTYTTVFHGLFAKIELQDKLVMSNIKIRKNQLKIFDNKERIEMDSGEFEKKFDVYATDKIIAMQLFTADIMQMIMDFSNENKLKPEITIKANKMYIRFSTGNVFEPKVLKRALDYDTIYKYYKMINFNIDLTKKLANNIKQTEL